MTGLSLALANLKPGTGKTTSAVWLAHVFSRAGNSVLLVDADPSGSALEWSDLAAMDPRLAPQLRPSEAVMLKETDCRLPRRGWGRIDLAASAARAGKDWTDDGTARQQRGLKHRAQHETRSIPIPPILVQLLRNHLKRYGTAPDGRIFRTARGGLIQDSAYSAVWADARTVALTPAQHASPLAGRPYDLRHAGVSLALNAGVPATEVARRAGHSVVVLLKIYAHCIDGQADAANKRIADALGSEETEDDDDRQ